MGDFIEESLAFAKKQKQKLATEQKITTKPQKDFIEESLEFAKTGKKAAPVAQPGPLAPGPRREGVIRPAPATAQISLFEKVKKVAKMIPSVIPVSLDPTDIPYTHINVPMRIDKRKLGEVQQTAKEIFFPLTPAEERESGRLAYLRQKEQRETFKKAGVTGREAPPSTYKEPGFFGQFAEGLQEGGYNSLASIGYFTEVLGRQAGSPRAIEWGKKFGDETTAKLLKRPELFAPADMQGFFEGGAKDPRYYGRVLGETVPFTVSTLAFASLGAVLGGPAGAAIGAYGATGALETGNAYKQYLDQGIAPDKAAKASGIYGAMAAILENSVGFSPKGIAERAFTKGATRNIAFSFKRYFRKELPKKMVAEATEESAQQFSQNLVAKFFDQSQGLWDGVAEAFPAGFIGSLPFGAAEVITSVNRRGAKQRQAGEEIAKKIAAEMAAVPPPVIPTTPAAELQKQFERRQATVPPVIPAPAVPAVVAPVPVEEAIPPKTETEEIMAVIDKALTQPKKEVVSIKPSKEEPTGEIEEEMFDIPESMSVLRDQLTELNKRMDTLEGAQKEKAIEIVNSYSEVFYDYVDSFKENILKVENPKYAIPFVSLDIIKYDDGKFGLSIEINISESGMSAGFTPQESFDTKEQAIQTGANRILQWVNNEMEGEPTLTQVAQLKKIIAGVKEVAPEATGEVKDERAELLAELEKHGIRGTYFEKMPVEQLREEAKKWKIEEAKITEKPEAKPKPKAKPIISAGAGNIPAVLISARKLNWKKSLSGSYVKAKDSYGNEMWQIFGDPPQEVLEVIKDFDDYKKKDIDKTLDEIIKDASPDEGRQDEKAVFTEIYDFKKTFKGKGVTLKVGGREVEMQKIFLDPIAKLYPNSTVFIDVSSERSPVRFEQDGKTIGVAMGFITEEDFKENIVNLTPPAEGAIIEVEKPKEKYGKQPTYQPVREEHRPEELPGPARVGEKEPGIAGETVEKRGGEVARRGYYISDDSVRERFGTQQGLNKFIEALIKEKGDNLAVYSDEELRLLSLYGGAGGLEKLGAEGRGLLDEYYTPQTIVKLVWNEIKNLLPEKETLNVVEPSVGTGAFLFQAPENAKITAYEISPTSAAITKLLYPAVEVRQEPFESLFIDERGNPLAPGIKADLVIGNPPFGEHRGKYKGLGEEPRIGEYSDYFLKRSLDITDEGGIVAMVVPSSFLRTGESYAKGEIAKLGELLKAFRLPNKIFGTTEIGTDIVIFRKNLTENYQSRLETLVSDAYFAKNPDNILGVEVERKGRYGMEKYVEGEITEADIEKIAESQEPADIVEEVENVTREIKEVVVREDAYVKNWQEDVNKEAQKVERAKPDKAILSPPLKKAPLLDLSKIDIGIDEQEKQTFLNTKATGELFNDFVKGLSDDDTLKYTNYQEEKWYNNFNYFQGNIYEKLDQLEKDILKIGPAQYQKQKAGLEKVLPKKATVENMLITPTSPFVRQTKIKYKAKYSEEFEETMLSEAFEHFIDDIPYEMFNPSSRRDVLDFLDEKPVIGRKDQPEYAQRKKAGRREVANKLFSLFLKDGLDEEQKKAVEDAYNRLFNGYYRPSYAQVPLESRVYSIFKGNALKIKPVQYEGIGFLINKGLGILAHDVGVGKTMQSIIAVNELIKKGWAKKPLIIVPTSVYNQWINEISEILPGVKINLLSNLGGDFKGNLDTLKIDDGTLSLITYEGFKRLSFRPETYDELTEELQDAMENPYERKTKRAEEAERARIEEVVGKAMRRTKEVYFEDLGFDHLTIDEVHNFNKIFSRAKVKEDERRKSQEFGGLMSRQPSQQGVKGWLAAQYVLKRNKDRNIFLLSATPFTNHPLEYYSILSLVGRERLKQMGLQNVNEFMTTFMDLTYEWEVTADGRFKERNNIKGFKNYQQFFKLLTEFIDFRDGEEAGVDRPQREVREFKLNPTELQLSLMDEAQKLFAEEFKRSGGMFQGIDEMRKITFSPYLSRFYKGEMPGYKEFVEDSPKIKQVLDNTSQTHKDNPEANQVIYSPIGVEYFPLLKEYLVKEGGFKSSEVGIITGSVDTEERYDIQTNFNKGKVKVIIGSDAIQEGLNLQEKTTDLHKISLTWNFTEQRQVDGRAWRQGNIWKKIRLNNYYIADSIDVFQAQKLATKAARYENSLKFKGNYLDTGLVDFDDLKVELIRDPVRRVEIEIALEKKKFEAELNQIKADLAYAERKIEKYTEKQDDITDLEANIERYTTRKEEAKKEGNIEDYEFYSKAIPKEENKLKKQKKELEELKKKFEERGIKLDKVALEKDRKVIEEKELEEKNLTEKYKEKIEDAKKQRVEIIVKDNDYKATTAEVAADNKTFFEYADWFLNQKQKGGVGSDAASIGAYADGTPVMIGGLNLIRPIKLPELVGLARELSGHVPNIKEWLSRAKGRMKEGKIDLKPSIFENTEQAAKILAHELGHLIDYVPEGTLSKGNLLARLLGLREYMRKTFGEKKVKNEDIRKELWQASQYWRPLLENPSQNYLRYRRSSRELYADAVSMLFNSPGLLEQMAPIFYKEFFTHLDTKPEVKEAYFELQALLAQDDAILIQMRREKTRGMFVTADKRALEIEKQRHEEAQARRGSIWFRAKRDVITLQQPLIDRLNTLKKQGITVNDEDNPVYLLNARNYLGGKIQAFVEKNFQPIYDELNENGLEWTDMGELLFYERILYGDRGKIANPGGMQPEFVQDVYGDLGTIEKDPVAEKSLATLRGSLGEERYKVLKSQADKYRLIIKQVFDDAYEAGLYTPELKAMFDENNFYVPFKTLKYQQTRTTFRVKKQIGTLLDIENPANTGIEKVISVIRAIEQQNVKKAIFKLLEKRFKTDIKDAETQWDGHRLVPLPPKDLPGFELIIYFENGKVRGKYIDRYIADSINKNTMAVVQGLRFLNKKWFRPIFITFNLGFQTYNLFRDFFRFWKNVPDMTMAKAVGLYYKTARPAKVRAFGKGIGEEEANKFIQEMKEEEILSFTYNDVLKEATDEDTQLDLILKRVGAKEGENQNRNPIIKALLGVLGFIEKLGNMIETIPKAAAYEYLKDKMPRNERNDFIRRKVGSPDFLATGYTTPATNNIFLFSNAIIQAVRADYEIATDPSTRAGWWWKATKLAVIPKIFIFAAMTGLMGDWLKEFYGKVTEYDKTYYLPLPLGIDNNKKAAYIRIPLDETDRLIGAIAWKILNAWRNEKTVGQDIGDIISLWGGQLPSMTPSLTTPYELFQFVSGTNPYDAFRNRNVLTDDQMAAGGWYSWKPFLKWEWEQLGGATFWKFNAGEYPGTQRSELERFLKLPFISNVFGRWIKIADFGEKEEVRDIQGAQRRERARKSLSEREVIDKYVRLYQETENKKNVPRLSKELVLEVVGHAPKNIDEKRKALSLQNRFEDAITKGAGNFYINALMSAPSNEEKVKLLKTFKELLEEKEWQELFDKVREQRVVSPEVLWRSRL